MLRAKLVTYCNFRSLLKLLYYPFPILNLGRQWRCLSALTLLWYHELFLAGLLTCSLPYLVGPDIDQRMSPSVSGLPNEVLYTS